MMTIGQSSINVHDHGVALDARKIRVQCNYCGKVMSGFYRLKCHLGDIGKDVVSCEKVPENIKVSFRNTVLQTRRKSLGKEVGNLSHPDLPWKRNCPPNSSGVKHVKRVAGQSAGRGSERLAKKDFVVVDRAAQYLPFCNRRIGSEIALNSEAQGDDLSRQTKKCIGRFLFETGIDFSVANSLSFGRMMNTICSNNQMNIPTPQELKGWILQDELEQMQEHVNKIRDSWARTGCSILLDGWVDDKGRNLVNFVVECPEGPIYLRSADVSAIVDNVNALYSLMEEVIDEVGERNIVQIMACSKTGWMGAVGKQYTSFKRTFFWSVSASHCIELMLEKISGKEPVKSVLNNAKVITKFIYGRSKVLKLTRCYTEGYDLIKPSNMKFAVPFLTLENMLTQKMNLENMVASFEWKNSCWASTLEGKRVANLVEDPSFWTAAEVAVRATVPLLRVLGLINSADEPQVGYIYETIDQAKETIKEEFRNKKSQYTPFWKAIDDVWNKCLHSYLHAAGFFLNPRFFYAADLSNDEEVMMGLMSCIFQLVRDLHMQVIISFQLEEYRLASGAFEEGSAVGIRNNVSPVQWWSTYGKDCPELQCFAIRVLSQTCDGPLKYGLKKGPAEKLLMHGRNHIEQQRLRDLTFVHYNLVLRDKQFVVGSDLVSEGIDPMDDWIVDETLEMAPRNADSEWMDMDFAEPTVSGEGPSSTRAKNEL